MKMPKTHQEAPKQERTKEQLQQEYINLLAQIGERVYQNEKRTEELKHLFKDMDTLQLEASKLMAQEAPAKDEPKEAEVLPLNKE